MKKILILIGLLLLSMICLGQTKIAKTYFITTRGERFDDTIQLNNDSGQDLPAPKLIDGSIFYNGEYVLNNVKSIRITKIIYYKQSNYKIISLGTRYNPYTGKWVKVSYLSDPEREKQEYEKYLNRKKDCLLCRKNEGDTLRKQLDTIK